MQREKFLLTERELAELRGCSPRTIAVERQRGGGVPFVRWGRSILYRWEDIQSFLAANVRTSTSDNSHA